MAIAETRDREVLRRFLRRDAGLHLYSIGDLDPRFWSDTRWWVIDEPPRAVVLLYQHPHLPTLLALGQDTQALRRLLGEIVGELPELTYFHLSPGLADVLHPRHGLRHAGRHLKMLLDRERLPEAVRESCVRTPGATREATADGIERLGLMDAEELVEFYSRSYPGHWFDPRTLAIGPYLGLRIDGRLVAAAGLHVLSMRERVAAIGNVATDPSHRGRGLARRITASLCHRLLRDVEHVGLNVHCENEAAIACYQRLGFEIVGEYHEYLSSAG